MHTNSLPIGLSPLQTRSTARQIDTHAPRTNIEPYRLSFSGSGGEFFRVWLVNLLLSIVTLGLYTPFARRRTAQYFYSHTDVAGSPLEFTAPQRKMVFGFLLLVALYMAFKLAADTGQEKAVSVLLLAGAALSPYLWASAMRFRLGATRWRGVRPQFVATWTEVYKASWPVFAIALAWMAMLLALSLFGGRPAAAKGSAAAAQVASLSAWALLPVLLGLVLTVLCIIRLEFNYKSLLVRRTRIGSQTGRWKPVYGDFVRIWLTTLAVFIASAAVIGGLFLLAFFAWAGALRNLGEWGLGNIILIVLVMVAAVFAVFLASAPARAFREARMFRLVWNNVGAGNIARFKSDLTAFDYVLLRIKNILLSLLTLGLYRPFAKVSEYRMKLESVTLHVRGGLDQLVGQLNDQQGALGDAMADAVGLDLVG